MDCKVARRSSTVSRKSRQHEQTHRASQGADREQTPSEDVEMKYLRQERTKRAGGASIKGKTTASMRARMWARYKPSLEHIEQNHMFKGKENKSVFITTKLCEISVLVHETMSDPDRVTVDKSNIREIYIKKFYHFSGSSWDFKGQVPHRKGCF